MAQLARWEEVFPDMDVLGELRKAREWLLVSSDRRKTARGMGKFAFAWLTRAQNGGRYLRRPKGSSSPSPRAGLTMLDEFGFETWEAWEETLRETFSGGELEVALENLGELRRRRERRDG